MMGRRNFILSTRRNSYHVAGVTGPLSLKWMARGWGIWRLSGKTLRVGTDTCLIVNNGQDYTIDIENEESSSSFCVFFQDGFVEDVARATTTPDEYLLDDPAGSAAPIAFHEHLIDDGRRILPRLRQMRSSQVSEEDSPDKYREQLRFLAEALVATQFDFRQSANKVPAVRPATRTELYRRLRNGKDYMHACFSDDLSVSTVAAACNLSPHHFHRHFTRTFNQTPHRYLSDLRIARAKVLLRETDRPITDICFDVGYESLGSFSRLFARRVGSSPSAYRRRHRT